MKQQSKQSGFSLIEVTVALAVLTVLMSLAFNLLNRFQVSYQVEQGYVDAARNARFAIVRMEEIIRSAGTNPTGRSAVNWLSFVDFGGGNSGSTLHLLSDLNGDGATASTLTSGGDVIIVSENVTLQLDTNTNTILMIDNNQPSGSPQRTVPIAENIRSLSFSDPDGSRREVVMDLVAVPSGIPTGDRRYREVHFSSIVRLRNR
jgi:prepilin-type N-terminal cleavage/methylation domain-containing protein